jgi:LacI family transcriptional regulator
MSKPIKTNQNGLGQAVDHPAGARTVPDFAGARGGRTVSIRDVADRAGVSIATVSRVINNEAGGVSEETRNRVRQYVEELGYRPNHAGRSLRAQSTDTYALVISNIQNAFYASVAWELERILNESGKVMLFFNTNENAALQDRAFEEINARRVNGIFVLCAVESRLLKATCEQNPVVFLNRMVKGIEDFSFVGIDDYSAARDLMQAILRNNPAPIGVIHGPNYSDTSARRLRGILEVAAERGMPIAQGDRREAQLTMESGYRCAVDLLQNKKYSAIYCGGDLIAYGVYRRCRELGLRVPEDVRIYGFDDNPLNEWLAPWLNTLRVPHVSMASAAIDQLLKLKDGGPHRSTILPYNIVLRT